MKAIVTGHKGGIGEAMMQCLHALGYEVVGLDISDGVDITDHACVVSALEDHQDATVLVNCAGIQVSKPMHKMLPGDFRDVVAVNLIGTFNVAHAMMAAMRDNTEQCHIINVSSIWGLDGCFGLSGYCASKAGVVNLTRVMSMEGSRKGVKVQCICPTYVNTPMVAGLPEDIKDKLKASIPRGEFLEPMEVATTIADMILGYNNETVFEYLG